MSDVQKSGEVRSRRSLTVKSQAVDSSHATPVEKHNNISQLKVDARLMKQE